jgi:hypothetical protein
MLLIDNISYSVGNIPINPKEGDMYYDNNTNRNNIYHKGQWFEIKFNLPKNMRRKEKVKAILN